MNIEEVIFKLLVVMALVLLNGFFVAAEFAIVKVRSTQIEPLAKSGHKRARIASNIIHHLDAYLSATQLGITLTSLGLGWVGEPFVAKMIEPLLRQWSASDAVLHSVSFTLGFGLITFLHIVFGELAPKSLAIQKAKMTTLWIAAPLNIFYIVFKPAIRLLNGAANIALRLVGLHSATESDIAHSEEELRLLLSHSQEKEVSALARRLALRAFDLRKHIVRQIMLPRRQIVYLDLKRPLNENLKVAQESKHTRFPLCDEGLDHTAGMLHMKDLLWASEHAEGDVDLTKIKRDILVVPETTGLERLLTTFQRSHQHMAIVVDEYGGTVGLVTIEDIIEELVGEIQDEFDQETPLIRETGKGEFLADGLAPLQQFNTVTGANFHSDDVDTLSGYLVEQLGRLPAENEAFEMGGLTFTVKKMGRRRIHHVHIRRIENTP